MRAGMTYDLRKDYLAEGYGEEETAEFDSEITIDAIAAVLKGRGYEVTQIGNVKALVARLAKGERWDFVFNFAEGMRGFAREAQIPAILDAYEIPYTFADPLTLSLSLDKAMTKRVLRDFDIPSAPFAVIEREADLQGIELPYPLFAKPLAEGTGKGVSPLSRCENFEALQAACRDLLARFRQPVLIETFLPGREFTVGILGSGEEASILGVLEILPRAGAEAHACSYKNKEHCEDLLEYRLIDDLESRLAAKTALAAWRALRCRDGGRVDLRSDAAGIPHFLEVNPLAGLHPSHSDLPILASQLGMPYEELIGRIVDSCLKRRAGDSSAR